MNISRLVLLALMYASFSLLATKNRKKGIGEVKLLLGFWASPYSLRIKEALKIKDVDYEYVEEDLWNKSQRILNYNPVHKKVPILIHTGKPIAESLVILECIDQIWNGNPILPQDPYDRAQAPFRAKFIDDQLTPTTRTALVRKGEIANRATAEAEELPKLLENEIKSGNKLFRGEGVGFMDMVGIVIAYWVPAIQEAAGKELLMQGSHPCICSWARRLVACSVVRENLRPHDNLVSFYGDHSKTVT